MHLSHTSRLLYLGFIDGCSAIMTIGQPFDTGEPFELSTNCAQARTIQQSIGESLTFNRFTNRCAVGELTAGMAQWQALVLLWEGVLTSMRMACLAIK